MAQLTILTYDQIHSGGLYNNPLFDQIIDNINLNDHYETLGSYMVKRITDDQIGLDLEIGHHAGIVYIKYFIYSGVSDESEDQAKQAINDYMSSYLPNLNFIIC